MSHFPPWDTTSFSCCVINPHIGWKVKKKIISLWRLEWSFLFEITFIPNFYQRVHCAKIDWNWPCGSEEKHDVFVKHQRPR